MFCCLKYCQNYHIVSSSQFQFQPFSNSPLQQILMQYKIDRHRNITTYRTAICIFSRAETPIIYSLNSSAVQSLIAAAARNKAFSTLPPELTSILHKQYPRSLDFWRQEDNEDPYWILNTAVLPEHHFRFPDLPHCRCRFQNHCQYPSRCLHRCPALSQPLFLHRRRYQYHRLHRFNITLSRFTRRTARLRLSGLLLLLRLRLLLSVNYIICSYRRRLLFCCCTVAAEAAVSAVPFSAAALPLPPPPPPPKVTSKICGGLCVKRYPKMPSRAAATI